MNTKPFPNPPSYQFGFQHAYKLACEELMRIDLKAQCLNSDSRLETAGSKKIVSLEYLNKSYRITFPEISISIADSKEDVPLKDKIMMLHYLLQAKGTPPLGRLIAYKELPGGTNYFPTFFKRAIRPVLGEFASSPQLLADIARNLGGSKTDYGDSAVTINAFKRVPITIVLWQGDEELPPEGNILFDGGICDYLSMDDINVLCETIAWRLVRLSQNR